MTEPIKNNDFTKARRKSERKAKASNGAGDWRDLYEQGPNGKPIPNLANNMIAHRNDPALQDLVALDEMANATMLLRPVPGQNVLGVEIKPRPIAEADISALQEYLQSNGFPKISRETVYQALDLRASECAFHPVRDYLNSLTWDRTPRVDRWLSYYVGAEYTPYTAAVGSLFLISMIARVERPGCKVDHTPILHGPQGIRKSTVCRILGGEWFSDNLPDITSGKDVQQHLAGKWVIELSELASLSKAETAILKAFLTRTEDIYRPPYARIEVRQKRQVVFLGTTNEAEVLKDETGGRRFWPVKAGTIDTDALVADRDQLFAEALHLYRAGKPWWPDGDFERQHIKPEQQAVIVRDIWLDSVANYVSTRNVVTIFDIATAALEIRKDMLGTQHQIRIRQILMQLGFQRKEKSSGKPALDGNGRVQFVRVQSTTEQFG